jgi:hypothetical protein
MDVGHYNRKFAAYVSPKQERSFKDLRRYGSGELCVHTNATW